MGRSSSERRVQPSSPSLRCMLGAVVIIGSLFFVFSFSLLQGSAFLNKTEDLNKTEELKEATGRCRSQQRNSRTSSSEPVLWDGIVLDKASCVRTCEATGCERWSWCDSCEKEGWDENCWLWKGTSTDTTSQVSGFTSGTCTPEQAWPLAIPPQLLYVAKQEHLEDVEGVLRKNIEDIVEQNPGIKLRWLGNPSCEKYLQSDPDLLKAFQEETHGSYKGDICRAVVLANEGGFYMDLDVQPRVPLRGMVDDNTTFMTAVTSDHMGLLNAIIAVPPRSPIMIETVNEIRKHYRGEGEPIPEPGKGPSIGPVTLLRGLRRVINRDCPTEGQEYEMPARDKDLGRGLSSHLRDFQWSCGNHVIRLYFEDQLRCDPDEASKECPLSRARTDFPGVKFGFFSPDPERNFVGWARFDACDDWGCNAGAVQVSLKNWKWKVPAQILFVSAQQSQADTSAELSEGIKKAVSLNPGIPVKWMGQSSCHEYLLGYGNDELFNAFKTASDVQIALDICRTVVLYKEGGFFLDYKAQPRMQLIDFIEEDTTLMAVLNQEHNGLQSTVMAVAPGCKVLEAVLEQIGRTIKQRTTWSASTVYYEGLASTINQRCHGVVIGLQQLRVSCGDDNVRLFHEEGLKCDDAPTAECSTRRAEHGWAGLRHGVFDPEKNVREASLMAWPVFEKCDDIDCFI